MKVIETKSLTKSYGASRGILDLNISVEEGDFFGFIGPNGAGKSTTIRTLLGLIGETSGTAEIFGKKVSDNKTQILKDIGYMPSEAMFYSGMRVKEVLRYSADLRKQDCTEEAKRLCERLQLDQTKKVEELSLGNRKKVSIICAMQHRPKLYIFDEPTSGLDPLIQREFFALLEESNKEGATIFFSSHVLSEVQRYCKHVAIIRDGRLIACDCVENLEKTNVKKVFVQGAFQMPSLDGIQEMEETVEGIRFLYNGKIPVLLKTLSELPLEDVRIEEPDLEEVFIHYYERGK